MSWGLANKTRTRHTDVARFQWSGTSAGWLGFERDIELCRAIQEATGIRTTTSVLALNKALELWGVKKLGLVTPYLDDVQEKIVANYAAIGIQIGEGMERHLRVEKNIEIAGITEEVLDGLVGEVVRGGVDAVTTFCTNLAAAQRAEFWEEKYGIPVFDTVTTVIWDMLRECGLDVGKVEGWGMIFRKG
jgi:maleate isomerase